MMYKFTDYKTESSLTMLKHVTWIHAGKFN